MFNDNGTIEGLTPTNHATSETTYGLAAKDTYGHVKLQTGDLSNKDYADGVAASVAHNFEGPVGVKNSPPFFPASDANKPIRII